MCGTHALLLIPGDVGSGKIFGTWRDGDKQARETDMRCSEHFPRVQSVEWGAQIPETQEQLGSYRKSEGWALGSKHANP